MPEYKEATIAEINSVLDQHLANNTVGKYKEIFDLVRKWWDGEPHKIVLSFENEYNDEGCDLRPHIDHVFDKNGNILKQIELSDDYDDPLSEDRWYTERSDTLQDFREDDVGEDQIKNDITLYSEIVPVKPLFVKI